MRTFIVVMVIVFVFFVGWYFVYESIDQYTSSLVNQLDNISNIIQEENWSMVSIEYDKMKDNWGKIRRLLTIILDHHEIDNIDISMARVDKYIETENLSLSLGEIEVIKELVKMVKEGESLSITTIF